MACIVIVLGEVVVEASRVSTMFALMIRVNAAQEYRAAMYPNDTRQ